MNSALLRGFIGMPQRMIRGYLVSHKLFQLLDIRKASLVFSGPDAGIVDINFKNPAGAGLKRELVNHSIECGQ